MLSVLAEVQAARQVAATGNPPVWDDTKAINTVIEQARIAGGDTVLFPSLQGAMPGAPMPGPKVYRIKTAGSVDTQGIAAASILLRSDVHLLFEAGMVLEAIPNAEEHLHPVIRGDDVENVSICGPGLIRGEWDKHEIEHTQFKASIKKDGTKWCLLEPAAGTVLPDPAKDEVVNVVVAGGAGTKDLHTRLRLDTSSGTTKWLLDRAAGGPLSNTVVTLLRGEGGMGVSLHGVQGFVLEGFTVENCWGDGVYVRGTLNQNGNPLRPSSNGLIRDVTSRWNRRTNLAIIDAHDIGVVGGAYYEAARPTEITPENASPSYQAVVDCGLIGARIGIDIEPDPDSIRQVYDVEIADVWAYGNAYDGIHAVSNDSWDIEIHGNTCCGNGKVWANAGSETREDPGSGIHIHRGVSVSVHDNDCYENFQGIRISGARQDYPAAAAYGVCARSNRCWKNKEAGLLIEDNVIGSAVRDNTCILNGWEGVRLAAMEEDEKPIDVPKTGWAIRGCYVGFNTCVANGLSTAPPANPEYDNMTLNGHCYFTVIRGNDLGPWGSQTFARHALSIWFDSYKTLVRGNHMSGGGLTKDFKDEGKQTDHDWSP